MGNLDGSKFSQLKIDSVSYSVLLIYTLGEFKNNCVRNIVLNEKLNINK